MKKSSYNDKNINYFQTMAFEQGIVPWVRDLTNHTHIWDIKVSEMVTFCSINIRVRFPLNNQSHFVRDPPFLAKIQILYRPFSMIFGKFNPLS